MKTVVDRRFLAWLLLCLAIATAGVHGLHVFQISRQSKFLLAEARRALSERQFDLATERFQEYAQFVPRDGDAQAELAQVLVDHGAPQQAADFYEQLLRDDPGRDDIRRQLAPIEIALGRSSDAKTHLQLLLRNSPTDAALLNLLGVCQAIGGEYAAANESLKRSISLAPNKVDAYSHLADVLRLLGRPVEADTWMEKLVQANPQSARAHLLEGQYLARIGRQAEGQQQAEAALRLSPSDPHALLLAAEFALDQTDYERASGFARRALEQAPNVAATYLTLARIEAARDHRSAAIDYLQSGVEQTHSRDSSLLWELGQMQLEAGDLAAAQRVVDTLNDFPTDARLRPLILFLEAQIGLASDHKQSAIERLERAASQLTQSPDLLKKIRLQIANCYEQLGSTDLQLSAFQQAAAIDPASVPARLGIVRSLIALGKLDEAVDECRQLEKLDGMAEAGSIGLARLLIQKNLARRASEQEWKEFDHVIEQLGRNNPDSIVVTLLRAESLAARQQLDEAKRVLLEARMKFINRTELYTASIELASRCGDWSLAEQLLSESANRFGDRLWIRSSRGSYLLARYKQQSASQLKALGDGATGFDPSERALLYRRLAELSVAAGAQAQAVEFAGKACELSPRSLEARLFLFDLAIGSRDDAAARHALAEIRTLDGEDPFWHYGQAALCISTSDATPALRETALQHINAARKLRPGWTSLLFLTAQIEDQQGHAGAALQNLLEAIDHGEHDPRAVRRAVELLYAQQRFSEADQLLRRVEQQPVLFSQDVERMASKVSARLDDLDRALDIAHKVADDTKDWRDQLWLGQLLGIKGLRAQNNGAAAAAARCFSDAEQSLRAAAKTSPEAPEPRVALIRFYMAIGRKPDAESAIHEAEQKLNSEAGALALASCYEAIGDAEQASKHYGLALSRGADDPLVVERVAEFELRSGALADAEAHLRSIVAQRIVCNAAQAAVARRTLAEVLRSTGRYPKLQEAIALLDENLATGAARDDLREKALVLASCPQFERRREASGILEQMLVSQPDADDLRFALSQLYLGLGDWPKASKLLRSLIASHERESSYLGIYIHQLLRRQETDEADLWLDRLRQIAPNEFETVSLRAESLIQRRQIDSALQVFRAWLAAAKDSPEEIGKRRRMVAYRIEALAQRLARGEQRVMGSDAVALFAESEAMFRQYAESKPEQRLELVRFLGRRGRATEAIRELKQVQAAFDPAALGQALSEILTGMPSDADALRQFERCLLASVGLHPDSLPLKTCLANLRERQGKFSDAEAICRDILKSDHFNLLAMNELAILLAAEKTRLDEAQDLMQRAIDEAGPLPALLDSRASVYLALGKPTEALADLDNAIAAEPRADRQFHRAMAYLQLGKADAVSQAMAAARSLGFKPAGLNALDRRNYEPLAAALGR